MELFQAFQIAFDEIDNAVKDHTTIIDERSDQYTTYERIKLCHMHLRLVVSRDSSLRQYRTIFEISQQQRFHINQAAKNIRKIKIRMFFEFVLDKKHIFKANIQKKFAFL